MSYLARLRQQSHLVIAGDAFYESDLTSCASPANGLDVADVVLREPLGRASSGTTLRHFVEWMTRLLRLGTVRF